MAPDYNYPDIIGISVFVREYYRGFDIRGLSVIILEQRGNGLEGAGAFQRNASPYMHFEDAYI